MYCPVGRDTGLRGMDVAGEQFQYDQKTDSGGHACGVMFFPLPESQKKVGRTGDLVRSLRRWPHMYEGFICGKKFPDYSTLKMDLFEDDWGYCLAEVSTDYEIRQLVGRAICQDEPNDTVESNFGAWNACSLSATRSGSPDRH